MTPEELAQVHERKLSEMLESISRAEERISAKATSIVNSARLKPQKATAASFWMAKQREINDVLAATRNRWRNWAGDSSEGAIVQAVRDGERLATQVIKDAANLEKKRSLPYDTKTINALIHDTVAVWNGATSSAKTQVTRLFRATQQDLIQEVNINRSITDGLLSSGTPRSISSSIASQLTQKAEDGQLVSAGGRNYAIADYAELVARTRINEAQTIGTIKTCQEYGVDLVEWVASADACEECQTHDGEVYSISGNDEEFPQLDERPPLHPHCTCRLAPHIRRDAA